jgi:hypothetical protein
MLSTIDVRVACCGDRDRSCGSRSSPDSLVVAGLSMASGKASRMDGRAGYPRLEGLYLAVWEGGVWGGEYASRCWDIIALTEVNYSLLRINSHARVIVVGSRGMPYRFCCRRTRYKVTGETDAPCSIRFDGLKGNSLGHCPKQCKRRKH